MIYRCVKKIGEIAHNNWEFLENLAWYMVFSNTTSNNGLGSPDDIGKKKLGVITM